MNTFCNTTGGSWVIFRELASVGHDHGGFFGPVQGTGEIICRCGKRFTRAELTTSAPKAAA